MEIMKVIGIAFIALFLIMTLKKRRDDFVIQISLLAGIIIFLIMMPKLTAIVSALQSLAIKANIDYYYITTVLKILGVAYLTSFCSEICKDAESSNLATKIEFGGKIIILALAIPIIMGVLDSILKIM